MTIDDKQKTTQFNLLGKKRQHKEYHRRKKYLSNSKKERRKKHRRKKVKNTPKRQLIFHFEEREKPKDQIVNINLNFSNRQETNYKR